MLDSWARAYAERWGLPHPAQAELQRVIDGVQAGLVADSQSETRPIAVGDVLDSSPTTPHRMPFGSMSPTSDRYEDQGLIKQGGMGEVRRVWDRALNRTVAMKLLRTDLLDREDLTLRFMEEAQATGQLEHPGIVPIYDIGTLEDGRPYFTMKEIRGRTLLDVIEELHIASDTGWKPSPTGWTFAKVVGVYHSVCKAVAYAHSRGVLHRDLKPTNVMVGAFGEVVVMDWGLAKIGRNGETVEVTSEPPSRQVVTTRSRANLYQTQTGSIAGTPNYMAPEQALGEAERVTQRSDVYSLGALLYEILADRAPYLGEDPQEVVAELLSGPPPSPYPPFQRPGQASAEEGLREICNRAMSREADDRYADAGALADAVSDWIDDASARERAIRLVEQADEVGPELISLRKRAATLRSRATSALAELPVTATVADKRSAWALEDQAAELDRELSRQQGRYVDLLHAALDSVPGLPQARGRLRGLEQLTGRAVAGDEAGSGWLTVVTEQPGVTVEIRRFENINRRLVAVPVEDVPGALVTPVEGLTLPVGSYQLRLRHAGLQPLTVLAKVDRGELWSTAPAGRTKPEPLRMVAPGTDPEGTVRIPRGWSWFGGDRETDDSFPRTRAWVPGFLIARHPVTNAAYEAFLSALLRAGRDDLAKFAAPAGWTSPAGAIARPASEDPQSPVRGITFDAATAFAAYTAKRSGRPWRLPREREWERAARGVDERMFPWGNFLDPAWSCVAASHGGSAPQPASIAAFPLDVSPWGVRGMGGNVRDWCIGDSAPRQGRVRPEHHWVRGGHHLGIAQLARPALRYQLATHHHPGVGLRLVCALDD